MGVLSQFSPQASLPPVKSADSRNRFVDLLVWCVYTSLLATVISHHEPWFDEAQAWLLARDVIFGQLITHYLRYEGSPGLWHYLLVIPAKTGMPYATMGWLACCIASAGVLMFLLAAPFPRWIRYLFPFSFFLFYQYAVVARSYVLLPLLLFSIASIYRRSGEHLLLFTLLTALLANVSLHGFVLAGALAAVFALKTYEKWSRITHTERIGRCATLLVLTIVALFIVLQLRRPPDLISFGALNLSPKHMLAVSALKLRDAFTGSFLLSVPILFASLWWFQQRRVLLTYLVGTGGLLILAGIAYSNVWHEGPLVLWWAFVMWIGWPKQSARIPRAVFACWAVFLMVHLFWSARSSWFDLRFPYSGSKQLAAYIQSQQLYRHNIFAFGPKSAAVLPYFQQGIFANWPSGRSFWFWSTSNKIESTFVDIPRLHPEFVILSVTRDGDHDLALRRQSLRSLGYCLSQRFDGALFWKTRILEGNFYELYATAPSNSETVNNCRESF